MEEKRAEIAAEWRKAKIQMRMFPVNRLKATNRKDHYPDIFEKIETLLESLLNLHEELFDLIEDKDETEMKAEEERCAQQEREIQDFLSDLEDHYYKLEAEEASSSNVSVRSVAELKQAMEEQLENKELNEEAIQFVQSNSQAMRWLGYPCTSNWDDTSSRGDQTSC